MFRRLWGPRGRRIGVCCSLEPPIRALKILSKAICRRDPVWREIGTDEAAIRRNPQATRDPLIIGVFGAGAQY